MNEYSEKADPTLVDLTLLGDDSAFEELVERHQKRVLGTAYKVTSNRWAAEDAAQDAFVSAWMHLSALEDKEAFGAWVCAISKNQAYRLMRRYCTAIDVSLDLAEFTEPADKATEDASELREAVDSLSEALRETVKLHYFGGYQISEIAEMLSIPVGTVKWRLSEARKQLRKGYGIMEKTYDENETLTERVMRQVEELKLWSLKSDKSGFEQDYRNVLAAVESLGESDRKQYALADVLMRGYWWLGGNKNELFARMKEAAVKSRNEDVMQTIVSKEMFDIKDRKERIEFTRGKLIPRLETEGWTKPLGYAWFWLGHDYGETGERGKMFEAFEKVTAILDESCVYYANALAAIHTEKRLDEVPDKSGVHYSATGEELKLIGGKVMFWRQPGYGGWNDTPAIFWADSLVDGLVLDPELKVGETVTTDNRKLSLTYLSDRETVVTPAGTFENCSHFKYSGAVYGLESSDTWFCPNVGIVAQSWTRYG
ncbi:MAG: RNA polymerase sigma factor, partial [Candidatus Flemingiibacterium sp.]